MPYKKSVLTLAQAISCEFCKIFKNTILYRIPPVTASVTSDIMVMTSAFFH